MKSYKLKLLPMMTMLILLTIISCKKEKLHDFDEPGNLVPKTVVEDPLLPRIEVNGTTLHGETFGDIPQ